MKYHPKQIGDKNTRYALIQEGQRPLFVIGLNPSTADESSPDPTMQFTMRIAEYNGYDGFIMLNLYPLRATKPKDLPKDCDIELHEQNLCEIENLLKSRTNVDVWLAFGNGISKRKYLSSCFKDILYLLKKYNAHLFYINNLTKAGYPPHPLYQKVDFFKGFNPPLPSLPHLIGSLHKALDYNYFQTSTCSRIRIRVCVISYLAFWASLCNLHFLCIHDFCCQLKPALDFYIIF